MHQRKCGADLILALKALKSEFSQLNPYQYGHAVYHFKNLKQHSLSTQMHFSLQHMKLGKKTQTGTPKVMKLFWPALKACVFDIRIADGVYCF